MKLGYLDSNQDPRIQSPVCCRCTISQYTFLKDNALYHRFSRKRKGPGYGLADGVPKPQRGEGDALPGAVRFFVRSDV